MAHLTCVRAEAASIAAFVAALRAAGVDNVLALRDVGLDFAVRQIRRLLESGAPGIHLYTLNKAELCLRLAQEAGLACG